MTTAVPGLPNEIVLEIWSHVLEPKDVESFALASKSIYALAYRFIEEHEMMKKRFSKFSHNDDRRGSPAANLLANILRSPRTAMYVNEILIDDWKIFWDMPATIVDHLPYPEDTMQLFEAAVKTSAFIPESETAEWISEIRVGDEENILALILSLLPNVRKFCLRSVIDLGKRLSQMILQVGNSPAAKALSRLRDFELGLVNDDFIDIDFGWVEKISSLKSVDNIKGWGVGHLHGESDKWLSIPSKWSNVTTLQLHNCNIDSQRLCTYLQSVRAFQEFSYTHSGEGSDLDAFSICVALAQASYSLKRLEIFSKDGMGKHMGSLAGFHVLTELCTEYRMLSNHDTEFAGDMLIQMLPPSVEKVSLEHCYNIRSLRNEVLGMCKLKGDRLPNLKALNYWTIYDFEAFGDSSPNPEDSGIISMLKQRSMEVGVELRVSYIIEGQE